MNRYLPMFAGVVATTTLLLAATVAGTGNAASACKITLDIKNSRYAGNPHLWELDNGLAYWGGKFWHGNQNRTLEVTVNMKTGRVVHAYTVPNANLVKTIQSGDHTNGKVCRG